MAAPSGSSETSDLSGEKLKSPQVTPQKVRQILAEGIATENLALNIPEPVAQQDSVNGIELAAGDIVSKEAFFSRVESYTSLKWAGKPAELSPLQCARYGWINIDFEMLKCSSCQAFLCATLQPTQDIAKYKERIEELQACLKKSHEKFCFWPDCPSTDHYWTLPLSEYSVLLNGLVQRYKTLCLLELQLPSIKPEDLKNMSISEDTISILLHLIEDNLKEQGTAPLKFFAEPLSVQMSSCILALCGWTTSQSLETYRLPVISCSLCLRKVGLWSFQQIESAVSEGVDGSGVNSSNLNTQEGRERLTPTCVSPCRMVLRSQDSARSQCTEQGDIASSPTLFRTRSRDSPSPIDETSGQLFRTKRPVTRSMGQGEVANIAAEVPSSPQRKAKRMRLCSSSSSDTPASRSFFDPVCQHKDWCPWVKAVDAKGISGVVSAQGDMPSLTKNTEKPEPGWKEALKVFLSMKKSESVTECSVPEGLPAKSKRVFSILRQMDAPCSK
ncbi:nuclear-interacting partner of ALK [Polypterus senegalus]|uniref:nuclear-interacting partner of ALK n=1 Tax=Polypterus senegalus TaxID=55291 RepID=UPI001965530D|nr:nuclear-interacting partner of ALK [Polypterus senegalus]